MQRFWLKMHYCMRKKQKKTSRHSGMQVVTLCISTTMVLLLLGLVVLSSFTAHNLSDYVKENLMVTIVLDDSVSAKEGLAFSKQLEKRCYARQVNFISKEAALEEQTAAMGSDPSEFLGMNPFVATIEMRVHADYANSDSLRLIAKVLRSHKSLVSDVAYQEDLTNSVNRNLQRALIVLLGLAVLLIIISYVLIANSVKLNMYSRRFAIHTMKLVGAKWGFIRKPFLKQALTIGVVSSLLACCVLGGIVWWLYQYQPGVEEVIGRNELIITGVAVVVFGFLMMLLCTLLSLNKFLRMTAEEVSKI